VSGPNDAKSGRIGQRWVLILPGILLGLILLTPVLVVSAHRLRDRRAVRRHEAAVGVFRTSGMR
jgi:uncharacterized membrane protein YhaH (DUF805 family)